MLRTCRAGADAELKAAAAVHQVKISLQQTAAGIALLTAGMHDIPFPVMPHHNYA